MGLPRARFFFISPIYFLAPATQAIRNWVCIHFFFKVLKLLWISEGGKKSPFKNSGNSWGEGGWGDANQRVFRGGGMDIFWNHTFTVILQNFVVAPYLHRFHAYHLQNSQ